MKRMWTSFRTSNEIVEQSPDIVQLQINHAVYTRPKSVKKGWIPRNIKVKIGKREDDFMQNLLSVVIYYEWIKTPRIARRKAGK